jgi:DNA-binding winged helix-turn-helix (wHTH) protein
VRGGEPVPLGPKLFDLLVLLVRNAGRLVERPQIVAAIWPDVFVSEANLRQKIWMLRRVLEDLDEAGAPLLPYVETVPRRGYRFVARVRQVGPPRHRRRWLAAALVLAAPVAALLASHAWSPGPAPSAGPRSVAVVGMRSLSSGARAIGHADALTEITRSELAGTDELRLLPDEMVARATRGPPPPEGAPLAAEALRALRAELGAELAVTGSYLIVGEGRGARVCVHLVAQHTASGDVVAAAHGSGEQRHLPQVMAKAGADLRRSLASSARR